MVDRSKILSEQPFQDGPTKAQVRARKIAGLPAFPPKARWPRFSTDEAALIEAFLIDALETADHSARRARELAKACPVDTGMDGSAKHWEGVISAIKWLISNIPHRQRSLAIKRYVERHGALPWDA